MPLLREMLDDILTLRRVQDPEVFNKIELVIQYKESDRESVARSEFTYEGGCLHGDTFVMDLKLCD